MTANPDPTDPAQFRDSEHPVREPSGDRASVRRSGLSRNMGMTAIFLVISAVAFCMIVVRQRDTNRRNISLKWAENIQVHLQSVLDERNFLPRALPPDPDVDPETLRIPYPSSDEIGRLEIQDQPFVLIAGPVRGMIRPGGDGCAVVVFDSGRVSTGWMNKTGVDAALERRIQLAAGPPTSDQ